MVATDILEDEIIPFGQREDYPLIMGGVTKNRCMSMIDVAMFNLCLDERKIKQDYGNKGEKVLSGMLSIS